MPVAKPIMSALSEDDSLSPSCSSSAWSMPCRQC